MSSSSDGTSAVMCMHALCFGLHDGNDGSDGGGDGDGYGGNSGDIGDH